MGECMEEKTDYSYVERRNFRSFCVAVACVGAGTWIGFKVVSGLGRMAWSVLS
jgi:hypothetical protein